MIKKLIHCSACNQVAPDYGDSGESQAQSLPEVQWSDADLAAAKEFLRVHSGHSLEGLTVEKETSVSEKPAYEPLGVTYVVAGIGARKLLIRRTRTGLDQPASYAIVPGKLRISNVSLRIQEEDLRRQIAAEKGFSLLLKRKMEKFIEAFREETAGISPKDFEKEAEAIEEGETSLIAYGSFKDFRWERILDRCCRLLKVSDQKAVRRFIDENRVPPEVLSIQIRRRISVISLQEAGAEKGVPEGKEAQAVKAESRAVAEKKAAKRRQ